MFMCIYKYIHIHVYLNFIYLLSRTSISRKARRAQSKSGKLVWHRPNPPCEKEPSWTMYRKYGYMLRLNLISLTSDGRPVIV